MSKSIIIILCLGTHIYAQQVDTLVLGPNQLEQLIGTWELVPGSFKVDPAPEGVEISNLSLTMVCELTTAGYFVSCTYKGHKQLAQVGVASEGQDLFIYEPSQQLVYKLGGVYNGTENLPVDQSYAKMFVTIGKGSFNRKGSLFLTEYLATDPGPAGKHLYMWESPDRLTEVTKYEDEEGNIVRQTLWIMQKRK